MDDIDPTTIESEAQLALQFELPYMERVDWRGAPATGTVSNIAQFPAVSMATVTPAAATGDDPGDTATVSTSARSVTISVKAVDVWPDLLSVMQGAVDVTSTLSEIVRLAYVAKIDTDFMALYTESATDIGASGTALTFTDHFLAAYELLFANKAPKPYTWMIPGVAISEIFSEPQFSQAQQYGRSVVDQDLDVQRGYQGFAPLGVPIYASNNYTASSGNHGIMFAKRGIRMNEAMPFRVNIDRTKLLNDERALKIGGTTIYGVGGTRATSTTNPWIVDIVS
jgi:hypothetical protein